MRVAPSPAAPSLAWGLLHELAQAPGASLPLAALGKRLGLAGSVVLRELQQLAQNSLSTSGEPWLTVEQSQGRWSARLTQAGQQAAQQLPLLPSPAQAFVADAGDPELLSPKSLVEVEPIAPPQWLAAECAVALVFNGVSHAVFMASPQDLPELALGFALSEGVIDSVADCYGCEVQSEPQGLAVHLQISSRCMARLQQQRRTLAGPSGCGLCGVESLAALDLEPAPLNPAPWASAIDAALVLRAVAQLPPQQTLNADCGALHAAAWATLAGELAWVFEDVGRHNALDKLLGHLAQQKCLDEPGFVVMSSRASYELVRKCARLGVQALATISAPTSLAVQLAQRARLSLWGLCRPPRALCYSGVALSHT